MKFTRVGAKKGFALDCGMKHLQPSFRGGGAGFAFERVLSGWDQNNRIQIVHLCGGTRKDQVAVVHRVESSPEKANAFLAHDKE